MCVLKGFNTTLAKTSTTSFPFGLYFANPDTLYVADEGNGTNTFANGSYTAAAGQTTAGLQKWVFDGTEWKLAYTLASGPEPGPALHRARLPDRDQRRDRAAVVTGHRRAAQHHRPGQQNGTVSIWAITSTVSGGGDQGADPNKLVEITDQVSATAPGAGETFSTLRTAARPGAARRLLHPRDPPGPLRLARWVAWTRRAMPPTPG